MTDLDCPGCGGSFPEGGAFHTHVDNCDGLSADQSGSEQGEIADRLDRIENRLGRLESALMEYEESEEAVEAWQNAEIVAIWRQLDSVADGVEAVVEQAGKRVEWDENPRRGPESPPETPELEISGGEGRSWR